MVKILTRVILLALLLVPLQGCGIFNMSSSAPEVQLVNIQPGEREGLRQRFMLSLLVVNTAGTSLNISGLSYGLKMENHKLVTGVVGNLKPIPPYSEVTVRVPASANLISGLKIVSQLMKKRQHSVKYQLDVKVDRGWFSLPARVVDRGTFDFSQWMGS